MSERARQHALLDWLMTLGIKCHYCSKTVERYNDIFQGFGVDPRDGLRELAPFQRQYLFSTMATVDHVVARQDGGKTQRDNVVLACWGCNQARHRKTKRKK